ncbi:Ca2+-dependent phosphoinositide-specific phospholipase C [Sphingomonas azotifigens]|uniref:Ca2+-dependent phosphoinositide-specific phospholipase C n=1 Tax=Sphingomonas azotifigens TaxID=330920 RepID=UPI0009FDCE49|nr:Ca2+-dependent phosphoinositide-specific phospholipase C [Sphingomonas azotifigens]
MRKGLMVGAAALLMAMAPGGAAPDADKSLDTLRLDQVRVLGSHNSYRPYPLPEVEARIRTLLPSSWEGLAYGHPPLESQLALGLRQLEIDVAPDPQGGAYAAPYANGTDEIKAEMAAPGAKTIHIPGIDWQTHCRTFRACMALFRRWSDAHPGHLPVMILVNASDVRPIPGVRTTDIGFDAATLDALDADIAATIGRERVITPDDVRGTLPTLRDAVTAHRWPTVGASRGKFLFVLDTSEANEARYRTGHASLKGRMMFGWYPEDAPEASFFNMQSPTTDSATITRRVKAGFMVRTRADSETLEARNHDRRRLDTAIASGAQIVSTDYYEGAPDPRGLNWVVSLGKSTVLCNSVTATCPKR